MPKPRYESLKSQFDEARSKNAIPEFIKTLETASKASHVDYFFRACAYDALNQTDNASQYFDWAIQLISPKDKYAPEMVKVVERFIQKTGQSALHALLVKRKLSTMEMPTSPTPPPKPMPTPTPAKNPPQPTAKTAKKEASPPKKASTSPKKEVAVPVVTTTPPPKKEATTQPKKKVIPKTVSTPTSKKVAIPSAITQMTPEQAFNEGKLAFTNNQLEKAHQLFEHAYLGGFRSARCILLLGTTLQRLKQYQKAVLYLDKGIALYQDKEDCILFLTLKAQIYSSQKQWGDSVKAYETLLNMTTAKQGTGQRRNALIQIINTYRWYLKQPKQVEKFLERLLAEFPNDAHVLTLQDELQTERPSAQKPSVAPIPEIKPAPIQVADEHPAPSIELPQTDEEKVRDIQHMADEVMYIIFEINETSQNHNRQMLFTPTNTDYLIYKYLKTPAYSRETFIHFASHIYLLIFERTTRKTTIHAQKLGLLPSEFQRKHLFVREVDAIRHAYGNAHITEPETFKTVRDSIPVGRVLERYLGSKNSPKDNQFIDLQYGLLHSLRDYLNDLHYYVAQNV